jgi:hypothetical protein
MYRNKFTLIDLVESGYLQDVMNPSVSSKMVFSKRAQEDVEVAGRVNMGSIERQVANVVQSSASSIAERARTTVYGGDVICKVKGDYEAIYNKIVDDLQSKTSLLGSSMSHTDELETAYKESYTAKLGNKEIPKLYLRINNLEEIKGMSDRQKKHLIDDVINNIYFNKDFARTQVSLGLRGKNKRDFFFTNKYSNERKSYSTLCRMWERKVGA